MPFNLSITWLPVEKTHDVVTSIQKSVVVYNDNERNDNNHGTGVHLLLHSGRQILKMYQVLKLLALFFQLKNRFPNLLSFFSSFYSI